MNHTQLLSLQRGRVQELTLFLTCAPNQFSMSSVFPVGSIWQPCSVSWASARQWFAPKWQRGQARLYWPTPFISSLLQFASASRWCLFHSSYDISERLDSLSPRRLHPDDLPHPLYYPMLSNNQLLILFIGYNLEMADNHCEFR